MSMFSDAATDSTVQQIVQHIELRLRAETNPEVRGALKEVGRFALTCFNWSAPEWSRRYYELFKI